MTTDDIFRHHKKLVEQLRIEGEEIISEEISDEVLESLLLDMNTPLALSKLHKHAKDKDVNNLIEGLDLLGLDLNKKE